ncbi:MAG: hypothetical protein ACI9ON_002423 [Limisphaerales bacterium]|jgi:hypothetical protein
MDHQSFAQLLGNYGEFVGAIAVVITLIYLTIQIRQNTKALQMNAASERLGRDYEIVLPVIENRAFAEVWVKGGDSVDELDEVDQQRLFLFERRALALWNHVYQLRMQGLLPDWSWNEQIWIMQNIGQRQALRESWELFKGSYEKAFQMFLEQQFLIGDAQIVSGSIQD